MINEKKILAIVPARSGSKGISNKNIQKVCGISLIGWAGIVLGKLPQIDVKIISTDSQEYIEEAHKFNLDAPFIRPEILSTDRASSIETVHHALVESEKYYACIFDLILIVEPTSPLRYPNDITNMLNIAIQTGADSVVAVSQLASKSHPKKILRVFNGLIQFYLEDGIEIKNRQELDTNYYYRNGVGYLLTRDCLLNKKAIFTQNTVPLVIDRPVVNIDDMLELEWAEFLMKKYKFEELLSDQ